MGVRRAVDLAEAALARPPAGPALPADKTARPGVPADETAGVTEPPPSIYTLGQLIHNPQVLSSLAEKGLAVLPEDPSRWPPLHNAVVIIRAHGTSPAIEEELRRRSARIIDAACSRVKASQNMARALAEKGYAIFIAGEKDHAEVRGIAAHAAAGCAAAGRPPVLIVGNAAEADEAASALVNSGPPDGAPGAPAAGDFSGAALIAQTTFQGEEYEAIARTLKRHFPRLEVKQTICGATAARQEALDKLCAGAEILVIAGGRDSANTRRLLSIAESRGKAALLAESAADLDAAAIRQLLSGRRIAGLSAGASTPDSVINEIEKKLEGM